MMDPPPILGGPTGSTEAAPSGISVPPPSIPWLHCAPRTVGRELAPQDPWCAGAALPTLVRGAPGVCRLRHLTQGDEDLAGAAGHRRESGTCRRYQQQEDQLHGGAPGLDGVDKAESLDA